MRSSLVIGRYMFTTGLQFTFFIKNIILSMQVRNHSKKLYCYFKIFRQLSYDITEFLLINHYFPKVQKDDLIKITNNDLSRNFGYNKLFCVSLKICFVVQLSLVNFCFENSYHLTFRCSKSTLRNSLRVINKKDKI